MARIDALKWVEELDGGLELKVPGQYNLGGIEIAQLFELSLQAKGIQATASFNEGTPEGELMFIDMGPINGWDSMDQRAFMLSLRADAGPIIPATPDQHEPPPPISGAGDLSCGKQLFCDEDLSYGEERGHSEQQAAGEETNQEEEGKEEEEEGVGNGAAVASAKRRRRI